MTESRKTRRARIERLARERGFVLDTATDGRPGYVLMGEAMLRLRPKHGYRVFRSLREVEKWLAEHASTPKSVEVMGVRGQIYPSRREKNQKACAPAGWGTTPRPPPRPKGAGG